MQKESGKLGQYVTIHHVRRGVISGLIVKETPFNFRVLLSGKMPGTKGSRLTYYPGETVKVLKRFIIKIENK